jgi:bifunctional NMN adenylyltransferase/nudix hydrolase
MENILNIKPDVDPSSAEIGVVMSRLQVAELHEGHKQLINTVLHYHKKVIIFLGMSKKPSDKNSPLDFANRRAMIHEAYPNVIVLPQLDMRDDYKWSSSLDAQISLPFGELSAVIYGSRDSFIPHYHGKYKVIEVLPKTPVNGTAERLAVSKEVISSVDFRKGIIYQTFAQRPVTYPTVDVVSYNDKGQILLAKKPNEGLYRFIGGFVDRTDACWEDAAKREFMEESGGCEIGDLKYVASSKINDWRYAKSESGIMTTLFLGKFLWGNPTASDDIAVLEWEYPSNISSRDIMVEHRELYIKLVEFMKTQMLIK